MHVPNWVKWLSIVGLAVWLMTDAKGMASVVTDIGEGVITFFKELGS